MGPGLSTAARLQRIPPKAILVGGTAAGLYAGHWLSTVRITCSAIPINDLTRSLRYWRASQAGRRPRAAPREDSGKPGWDRDRYPAADPAAPLERIQIAWEAQELTVPTLAEILHIKAVLILKRNATRDYLDFVALACGMATDVCVGLLGPFDDLYPQPNEEAPLRQLQIQLSNPHPYDLEEIHLSEYKHLAERWQGWRAVRTACREAAMVIFDRIVGVEESPDPGQ